MKIKIKHPIIYKALYIMGNYSSTIKNKNNESMANFKELNYNNTEFLAKLNEIATDYILGQNFQDMIRLTNSKYCNDLVIITSKILKKSFFSNQIQVIYNKISESDMRHMSYVSGSNQKEQTKKMCIEIAKYYVKIAHLFAAIMTTLNPVFSWRSSASSSRAVLSPHVPDEQKPGVQGIEGMEGVEDLSSTIEKTTLENKHYISQMAKDVKIENLNFCNSRIADLMDMDELGDLLQDESITNAVNGQQPVSEIKIKTKLCSSNLNNVSNIVGDSSGGIRKVKTVYDLPGFAELSRLYNDKYNVSKGRFDKMSAKSREEKKRNIDLLYTLFTGNPNTPTDIRSFRDIPLHSFSDTADCSTPGSMLNKTYVGNTKDKLFVDYVEQVKRMIYESNMTRNMLLEVIDSIFITNTLKESDATEDESGTKMKYIIDPNLTYEELNNLIDETRKIILKLYVNCEKNFIHTLKILQAIIEAQMLETGQRQIRELERTIDAEY
jgi:hypothetical protein